MKLNTKTLATAALAGIFAAGTASAKTVTNDQNSAPGITAEKEGCSGKDGCSAKKKENDKQKCSGKDGCSGKEKKDSAIL